MANKYKIEITETSNLGSGLRVFVNIEIAGTTYSRDFVVESMVALKNAILSEVDKIKRILVLETEVEIGPLIIEDEIPTTQDAHDTKNAIYLKELGRLRDAKEELELGVISESDYSKILGEVKIKKQRPIL